MKYEDIIEMLEEIGLPFAYDHFAEGESPDPPFMVFLIPSDEIMYADNTAYFVQGELHIELYTDKKDPELEIAVASVLSRHELPYSREEYWIESEKMYEVLFIMEV